jgi:hypothetical protein
MDSAVTKPTWYEIKHNVFGALLATEWKSGIVASDHPAVTVRRDRFCSAPAGRGDEVVATMRACLQAYGYRVKVRRYRNTAGDRWAILTGE